MKIHQIKAWAKIQFPDGNYARTEILINVKGEDAREVWRNMYDKATISFGREHFTYIGESYEVKSHDKVSFMGIKFNPNKIKEVSHYPNDNTIYLNTEDDEYGFSYGHIAKSEREELIDNLFAELNIKRV